MVARHEHRWSVWERVVIKPDGDGGFVMVGHPDGGFRTRQCSYCGGVEVEAITKDYHEGANRAVFGAWVRRMREERELSQAELAARIDASASYVSKIEAGAVGAPSVRLMRVLSDALSVEYRDVARMARRYPETASKRQVEAEWWELVEAVEWAARRLASDGDPETIAMGLDAVVERIGKGRRDG